MCKIYRKGKLFVLAEYEGGPEQGTYQDFNAAQSALESLRETKRQERTLDPAIQEQRARKNAYSIVERNPYLRMLKNCLPRKGEIQRTTQRGYNKSLAFLDKVMTGRTPGQSRTAAATETRQQQRDETREKYLSLQAQGKNQKEAARILGITPRGLRNIIKGR